MRGMKRAAFSLVELMLVVVIMGIVGALILLNMSTSERIDAQAEARRYVRSVYSVRGAWIAYMADRHVFLGVPGASDMGAVLKSLDLYTDRAGLADDVKRYGSIVIETVPVNEYYSRIFLGFDGNGDFGGKTPGDTIDILNGEFGAGYRLTSIDASIIDSVKNNNLMLRVW